MEISAEAQARAGRLSRSASRVMSRVIQERCGEGDGPRIVLDVRQGIGSGAYHVSDSPGGVCVAGGDGRGLIYGVGKLLRDGRFEPGRFAAGPWRGRSVPQKPVRGMYFATHFHNFYHDAPVAEVVRYVEELALWGCSTLAVWFDMHHFQGIGDPEAVAMLERLRAILRAGEEVGIGASLVCLSNEGYDSSPVELRADWTAGHDGYTSPPGGHYHREVCPSKPGGMDYILRVRREMFDAFADLDVRHVWVWPYDQGGCTCTRCTPWGANGFLRCAEPVARLAHETWPAARVILSTWYFDHFIAGEWEGLYERLRRGPLPGVDMLLADDFGGFPEYPLQHGAPGGLSMVGFPEISMERMFPWGGFGANPRPAHWQADWDKVGRLLSGGFPYSEGIFEDINKAVMLQFYWGGRTALDTVREYAAYEFSPAVAEDVTRAIGGMESAMNHGVTSAFRNYAGARASGGKAGPAPPIYKVGGDPNAYARLIEAADRRLPAYARRGWRWRVLYVRAALDKELHESGGRPTARSEELFAELVRIYAARGADYAVVPPSCRSLSRFHGPWLMDLVDGAGA